MCGSVGRSRHTSLNQELANEGADGSIDFRDPEDMELNGRMLQATVERYSFEVSLKLMQQICFVAVPIAELVVINADTLRAATAPHSPQAALGTELRS